MEKDAKIMVEYLSRIEDELMEIKNELKGLEQRKVNWQIVMELTKRVEKLEKEVASQRNRLKVK